MDDAGQELELRAQGPVRHRGHRPVPPRRGAGSRPGVAEVLHGQARRDAAAHREKAPRQQERPRRRERFEGDGPGDAGPEADGAAGSHGPDGGTDRPAGSGGRGPQDGRRVRAARRLVGVQPRQIHLRGQTGRYTVLDRPPLQDDGRFDQDVESENSRRSPDRRPASHRLPARELAFALGFVWLAAGFAGTAQDSRREGGQPPRDNRRPSAPTLAGTASIRGRVVNDAGDPLRKARVTLSGAPGAGLPSPFFAGRGGGPPPPPAAENVSPPSTFTDNDGR